ncbi:putative ras GTPase activator [Cutaneotrichosporon oleaginosum]|uniref:Putative ras GTPase activator n=1 Tax=Cutaneotrichosporon oleaginosum TaxID=879819 RepID=A0A0J0XGS8_9TREE|nr:putative ras GTPase activator [Cutaneotrichosporon oleaginosum]KLT40305.1 putative ras GTPase activator [Cutaneotrichosporon oleaginosum]TXT07983.1 hypothetical protein COLE_04907 [Cutaneotrichosporon oleaginosum]
MPLRRTSGHTFSSPSNRIRSSDIQHTDNPSLHDGSSANSGYTRQDPLVGEQKVVTSIVSRLVNKLPCNSGIKLAMMEIDEGVKTTVESLLQISRIRLPLVVHALASSLETLSKYSGTGALIDAPLDTIHSQLYLLQILVQCLSESWNLNANASTPPHSELPACWPDPPPLDDHLARHLLGVLVIYIRMLSQESSHGNSAGSLAQVSNRDGKSPSSTSVAAWGAQINAPGASSFSLGANFIQGHSYPSATTPRPPGIPEHARLLAPTASSHASAIKQMTKRTARVIFYLSASNWPLVLSRIKARVAHLTTTLEENPELFELRFLEWANVDATRLAQALQEISTPFLHVKRPAQTALASALRKAIWNWIEVYPAEYQALIEGTRKLDGNPDVLFDVLLSLSDSSSTNKRVKVFYPLMAMLLVLSPDSLKRLAMGDVSRGGSALAKKHNFLDSLRKGLSQSKSYEACAICYVDLVRAAMCCSPRLETSGIRTLAPDLQNDLKNALFYSSLAAEITDINIIVDGLVALYRFNPTGTTQVIFPKLWTDNSDNSKIIGVRACTALVMEGQRLPWHPGIGGLRAEVARAIRGMLRSTAPSVINQGINRRGRSSLDLPSTQTDVTWEILNLMALDPSFAYEGLGDSQDTLGNLLGGISSLTAVSCPMTIRAQAAKTNLVLLDRLVEQCKTDPARANQANQSALFIWQILIDSSRRFLVDFQLGDIDDMAMMCGAFRSTVHSMLNVVTSLPELAKAPAARPAVLVAKVATVTSLTGPDVEQTNMAAPALQALSKLMIVVRSSVSNSQAQMDEITGHSNMLAELGSLPPATGRNQQQRAIRRIMKSHVRSSTLLGGVWIGLAARLRILTNKIHTAESDESEKDYGRRRNMAADIEGLTEDESKEWQNLVSFLCATSGVCASDTAAIPNISDVVGKGVLPRVYDEATDLPAQVESLLRECVDFLVSNSIYVRESIKDALGNELPLSLCRVLVVQMTKLLSHSTGPTGVATSEAFTTFVDQVVAVIRLWVERVSPGENSGVQVDLGELLYLIAQYTHRLGREDASQRIKIKFCQLFEAVLGKPEFVVLGNATKLRNAVLEWMCEWSIETLRDEFHIGIQDKVQRDLDISCLRAMIPITDGLVIRSAGDDSEDSQNVAKARLFYRYYVLLVRVLERSNNHESESSHVARSVSNMSTKAGSSESYQALAILVLSNLLSANVDVGLKHCLSLAYHEDSTIRTAFMQLVSNILQQGTRFGGLAVKNATAPKGYFDALASPNLSLAVAICEVCPPNELDEMSSLLFRVFESKGNLLSLMKVLVERDVGLTSHESELFRANSIMTRLMTTFAKTYGYNYVRGCLTPLVVSMGEKPIECSFELDPAKSSATEDIDRNAEHLRLMCQALLDIIYSSTPNLPVLFRALCHHIWEVVDDRFPDSRHSAIGSFIFLRFFCPAIVSPENIDLDIPAERRDTRRALVLITKVIQNLANNVLFGSKEVHMKVLNQFLSDNIRQVTKFLADVAQRPRSWEVAAATKMYQEETERSIDVEADNVIIQKFIFKHFARLEPALENMPTSYRTRQGTSSRSVRLDLDGKGALANLRRIMEETGPLPDPVLLSVSARSQVYDDFMRHNAGRNTDSAASAFYEGQPNQTGRRIFYLILARVALVDYDLLAYRIFSLLDSVTDFFDVIIDMTDFSPQSEIPVPWLRRSLQMCPPQIMPLIHTLVLYNPNSYVKKRFRPLLAEFLPYAPTMKNVIAASSPAEIHDYIPAFNGYELPERTKVLAYNAENVFTNLLCVSDHEQLVPVVVKLSTESIQVASWRKQDLTPTVKSYIIDVIDLAEVNEITMGRQNADQLTLKYSHNKTVTFTSRMERNELAQIIRAAVSRFRNTPSDDRILRPTDVPGTLLNVAFLNLSSSDETLRLGAYNLVHELCQFFKYDLASQVLKVSTGLTIPSNSLSFVYKLSNALATTAQTLTLEFLKEWTVGFSKADTPQKAACLHYVGPWLKNLEQFAKPSRDDGVENTKQVADVVRGLIALTVAERKRLHLSIQEHVWKVLAGSHEALIDLIVRELLHLAVNAGPGSEKAEGAADILVSLSSTAVRGKVVARLRKSIGQTCVKPTNLLSDSPSWNEICTLARINLALAFSPPNALDTQLFLPDLFHTIVLISGIGPVMMRQIVYGLVINILQSLATIAAAGEMDATTLQHLLQRAQQPEMIHAFGLVQNPGSLELAGALHWDPTGVAHLDSLYKVTNFLGDVLTAGAPSMDCANAWRARWMGLVAATCFQHNPATQPQAFIALGYLAQDDVDDDVVYQIVVALSGAFSHFHEDDTVPVVSMLRCLARVMGGLHTDSKYANVLFWIAVSILQLAYIPLFGPALELLLTTIRHMRATHSSKNIFGELMETRAATGEQASRLDQMCGVNFDTDPYYSLVAIINKGVRHPNTRALTIETLTELLRLSCAEEAIEDRDRLIQGRSVPFFTALLPLSASSTASVSELLQVANVALENDKMPDIANLGVYDLLSLPDNSKVLLFVTLIVTILTNVSSDAEKLVLYRLLADASMDAPDVVATAYDTLIPRMTGVLTTTTSTAILQNVTLIFERAMADASYTFPTGIATDSSSSVHKKNYSASVSSGQTNINVRPRDQVLEDLGMKGLTDMSFSGVKLDRLSNMSKYIATLIDAFSQSI